jgi:sporulation protein YlmC with PRC-barrel domain
MGSSTSIQEKGGDQINAVRELITRTANKREERIMNWNASELTGYDIHASDGSIGSVVDLLFDDNEWTVRWLVIDTGNWLPGRQVLLPPSCVERTESVRRQLQVELTRKQIEESPGLDSDAPVSRQKEAEIYSYYGWPGYWAGGVGEPAVYRPIVPPLTEAGAPTQRAAGAPTQRAAGAPTQRNDAPLDQGLTERQQQRERNGDPHLRSTGSVTGLSIYATDGAMGHVEDFIVDDRGWVIRYMVVDTVNWWPGRKVLVSPNWVVDISWDEQNVTVELTRDQIEHSPEYEPGKLVDRGYEERLYTHYRQPPYWV